MEKIPSRSSPVTEPSWLAGLMALRCGRPSACKHLRQWFWGVVAAVIFAGVYPASYAIAQQVFWTEANSGFSVLASNLDGSGLTTIATIGGPVRSLAVLPGTNQIFWSVEGANA